MGADKSNGDTDPKTATQDTAVAMSLDELAGQLGASKDTPSDSKADADTKKKPAKEKTEPDSEEEADDAEEADEAAADGGSDDDAQEDEAEDESEDDEGEDSKEASEEDDAGDDDAGGDADDAEEESEDDEGDDDADEALSAAERALEKAIESGKLPLGLQKRLAKAEKKVEEAEARAAQAEQKLAEAAERPDEGNPISNDVAGIADAAGLSAYEKRAKTVFEFCDDALELLGDDPEGVEQQLRTAKVALKDAAGEDDYSPAAMKRWLLSMRREARRKLSDDIPARRQQIEAEGKAYAEVLALYPDLKRRDSGISKDVTSILKKMRPDAFTDPLLNANRHRIIIWALRGRAAEAADLKSAESKTGKDAKKPKPKVKSPSPKGGGAERVSRQQQSAAAFKRVDDHPTESNFAEALANELGG